MDPIDELGIFWLPERDDDSLTGRLVFEPGGKGVRLFLVGAFGQGDAIDSDDSDGESTERIFGWLGNDKVTLDRCYRSSEEHRSPGPTQTSYYANRLFIGYHLVDEIEFDTVALFLDHLSSWVGHAGITRTSVGSSHTINYTPPEEGSSSFSRGEVSLGFSRTISPSSFESASVSSTPRFQISYQQRQSFKAIQTDIGYLEDLVAICVGAPVIVNEVVLSRSDATVEMLDGSRSNIAQPVRFRASRLNYVPPAERKVRNQHQLLLSYQELGGIRVVGHWLDKAAQFRRPLNSLMSIVRSTGMFTENRFMNVTYAAEALHRGLVGGGQEMSPDTFDSLLTNYLEHTPAEHQRWLRSRLSFSNEPSLGKRLNDLAVRTGPIAKVLVGDRRRWTNTVLQIRNDLTHLGSSDEGPDGQDLLFLAESVFIIVKIFLLLEVGVPLDLLARKVNDSEMVSYRDRIIESIEGARDYLRPSDHA